METQEGLSPQERMELNAFVHKALTNIIHGVEGAQKDIWHGEIIPKKEGKRGEVDIDFEVAVEAKEGKVFVVMPPAPPLPHLSKLRFKIPVRLPVKRKTTWCYQVLKAPCSRSKGESQKKRSKKAVEQAETTEKSPSILQYFYETIRRCLKKHQKKSSEKSERQERPYRG
jgi:hypothetical protein